MGGLVASSVQISVTINQAHFPRFIIQCDHELLAIRIKEIFSGLKYSLGHFLTLMNASKISLKANLQDMQSENVLKVVCALDSFAVANARKLESADLKKRNYQADGSLTDDGLDQSLRQAEAEIAKARAALEKVEQSTKIHCVYN